MGVAQKIRRLVSNLTDVPVDRIDDHEPLNRSSVELYLDSLDRVQLAIDLEDEFGLEIPDSDVDKMEPTIAGIASYISRRLAH